MALGEPIHLPSGSYGWRWTTIGVLGLAAVSWAWLARYLFLDDAFIHLRVARSLLDHGFYSFNGDAPAYCTSSPLYTALLALCSRIIGTAYLPKLLDWAIYAVLFALLASKLLVTSFRQGQFFWTIFLVAVTSPLAMRWLTDGMETGLAGVFALLLADAAHAIYCDTSKPTAGRMLGFGLLGALALTLRIEFGLLIAAIGVSSLSAYRQRGFNERAVALACGAAIGLAIIVMLFGRVLPDTAIAKANALSDLTRWQALLATINDLIKAHAAASSLGILISGSMLWTFSIAARTTRNPAFVWLTNASLPLLLALVIWRQQSIQGYRYFVFIEFFLLAFNTLLVCELTTAVQQPLQRAMSGRSIALASVAALLFLGWQTFEFLKLQTISAGRAQSYEKFSRSDWRDLRNTYGLAWDVGMIGYFSNATILDGNGLINGPDIARMSRPDRLRAFVTSHSVRFVFVDAAQLALLHGFLDVSLWATRETFDFPNFSGEPDRHFLLVRKD